MIKTNSNDIVKSTENDNDKRIKVKNEVKKSNKMKSEIILSDKSELKSENKKEILITPSKFTEEKKKATETLNKLESQKNYKSNDTKKVLQTEYCMELEISKNSNVTEPFNVSSSNIEDPSNESNKIIIQMTPTIKRIK